MKGVMMKIGQMASYVDDGLSPAVRRTLARLQDSVPPMSPGRHPDRRGRGRVAGAPPGDCGVKCVKPHGRGPPHRPNSSPTGRGGWPGHGAHLVRMNKVYYLY
jgi:hypothetical protein